MGLCRFLLVCLVSVPMPLAVSRAGADPVPLHLDRAWSVSGPGRFDASGLMVRDRVFYVVSDRHGDSVFRLEFDGESARAVVHVTFTGPEPYPWIGYMDLEGIAPAPDGGFYLAPEWGFAVCHVPAAGGTARWATPDIKAAGEAAGLFATRDAYVESVAVLDDGTILLASERAPRGIVEVRGGVNAERVAVQRMETSRYPVAERRGLDWSDLTVWRGRLFALARNQHLVVELVRERDGAGAWIEGDAWSYAEAENAAAHHFTDMTFGQAEGLAITDEAIHVLIDNNNLERASAPGDRRSWLFALRNEIPR